MLLAILIVIPMVAFTRPDRPLDPELVGVLNPELEVGVIDQGFSLRYVRANIYSLIQFNELPGLGRRHDGFGDSFVNTVREIFDFSGHRYFIVEFHPFGYIIFDNRFTTVLEMSVDSASPFVNQNGALIYGGPTHYYIMPDAQPRNGYALFIHTVLGTEMLVNQEEMQVLRAYSTMMAHSVENTANETVLEESIMSSSDSINPFFITGTTIVDLSQWRVIANTDTSGFNQGGNCGYVAAALVVYYHFRVLGWNQFVSPILHLTAGRLNVNLVRGIQGNRPNSAWGPDVAGAMSQWSSAHGAGWLILGVPFNVLPANTLLLPSSSQIFNLIQQDRPVILFGEMRTAANNNLVGQGKIRHAIVIHGMDRHARLFSTDWYYVAHFGWGTSTNRVYFHDSVSNIFRGSAVFF